MESKTFTLTATTDGIPDGLPADSPQTLLTVFADRKFDVAPVLAALATRFPNSVCVGCSSAGEIADASVQVGGCVVNVTRFKTTRLQTAAAAIDATSSFEAGRQVAGALADPKLRLAFALAEGLHVNGSALVRGMNSTLPRDVIITGGLSGDGPDFNETWIIDGFEVKRNQVVVVGFIGDELEVGHGSGGGWTSFGPDRLVTRSEGNVLFELDGRPALALYEEYLGDMAGELPAAALRFPLRVRSEARPDPVVRTILGIDRANGSMTFAGDVPEGAHARLMRANFDQLVDGASSAAKEALVRGEHDGPVFVLAVSCVGRRLVLGERADDEAEEVFATYPEGSVVVGFYSYGELSPVGDGVCDLLNQTMTLTTLRER